MNVEMWQWVLLIAINIALFIISPWSTKLQDFFQGSNNDRAPNVWFLTSSLVICWLFAKSVTNAIDLGYSHGMPGGVAYAGYYLSFMVAGIIIYRMRTIGNYISIHHFLHKKYGLLAVRIFSILISIRLLNEIWSNTMIVGSYFGTVGSTSYYSAILVFTVFTLAYTMKGGMRSSILTDVIQMVLFGFLLFLILWIIIPKTEGGVYQLVNTGTWAMSNGLNLFFVAILQIFSYPWHDPIMTDRGFISTPKKTLTAFILATLIGIICILLISLVGIFGSKQNLPFPIAMEVARGLGIPMMIIMNLIMVTSAASTIDSTFTSSVKLIHVDILKSKNLNISNARWSMILIALAGTIPVFFNPEILSATTVSGTMVLGLAPIFVFWQWNAPRISYYLSVSVGIIAGFLFVFFPIPSSWLFTDGKYADLLFINIIATILCFVSFTVPYLIIKHGTKHT